VESIYIQALSINYNNNYNGHTVKKRYPTWDINYP
jgi:hypothetical protein